MADDPTRDLDAILQDQLSTPADDLYRTVAALDAVTHGLDVVDDVTCPSCGTKSTRPPVPEGVVAALQRALGSFREAVDRLAEERNR